MSDDDKGSDDAMSGDGGNVGKMMKSMLMAITVTMTMMMMMMMMLSMDSFPTTHPSSDRML